MLKRRTFLGGAIASSFFGRLQGDTRPCSDSDVQDLGKKTLAGYAPPRPGEVVAFSIEDTLGSARRPLWSELVAENTLDAYGRTLQAAYREMQKRSHDDRYDPCGLMYQGWLHWFRCPPDTSREDIHGSSGFLPWHRAYLYFYERLIQQLTHEPGFRLATWDWEKPGNLAIPPIYEDQDFFPSMGCAYKREGRTFTPGNVVAYLQNNGMPGASHWFLGGKTYAGGATLGPHMAVHLGVSGLMGDLGVAAFDPVFFAHHANIDRLWDFWYQRYKSVPGFFAGQTWPPSSDPWVFYDAKIGRYVSVEPKHMLHIETLGYHYARPQITLFEYSILRGAPTRNQIAFDETNVAQFFREMEDAVKDAVVKLPAAFTSLTQPHIGELLAAIPNFSLPVIAHFSGLEHEASGSYDVLLNDVRLGEFSILHGDHSMGPVTAFLSLAYPDLAILRTAMTMPATITCKPNLPLHLESFELHYPACADAWKDLISTSPDPQSYHNCRS